MESRELTVYFHQLLLIDFLLLLCLLIVSVNLWPDFSMLRFLLRLSSLSDIVAKPRGAKSAAGR